MKLSLAENILTGAVIVLLKLATAAVLLLTWLTSWRVLDKNLVLVNIYLLQQDTSALALITSKIFVN